MKKFYTLLLFGVFIVTHAIAGGYQVGLHGIKQIGMGLGGTALIFDASSLFYNPGGTSLINDKYSFAIGANGIRSYTIYRKSEPSATEALTNNPWGTPFYFYGSAKVTDRITAGLAINTPFGNSLSWGDDWVGRYLIQDLSLRAIFYQPTISVKLNDKIGVGVGLVIATGKFELNKALPVADANGEGSISLEGTANKIGFNAGLLFKPIDDLSIGVDYRSSVNMITDDATATFNVPVSLRQNFPDTKVSTELPLPANLDFGVAYNFSEKLLGSISINYVFWGSYDSLIFDFEQNTPSLADSRNPRLYSDRMIIRGGIQYKASDKLHLRTGAYYDPSPVNKDFFSPETPSLNSIGISAGLSYYPVQRLAIDLSFLYISGQEGDRAYTPDNFSGTFKTRTYIPGFGLTYNF